MEREVLRVPSAQLSEGDHIFHDGAEYEVVQDARRERFDYVRLVIANAMGETKTVFIHQSEEIEVT